MSPLAADGQRTTFTSPSSSPEEVSVSTVAATAVGTGYHLLKVEGYSRLKHTHGKNGSYLESSAFKAAGKTWTIRCYLNGYRKEDAGFVSLFLNYCDGVAAGSVVHAEFEFALVQQQHHHHGTGHPPNSSARATAFGKGQSNWGFPQIISTEALEGSRFLEDDCFAVRCKVTVVEERTARKEAVRAQDMERLGLLCKCDDDTCKRHHARTTLGLREVLARFLSSMCSP
ncbi:hypothetical protein BS78_02G028600 [Paspalum vaginatum]|nr:hypothetical protein BS78_02G028600 [Paspalum vaginatum]